MVRLDGKGFHNSTAITGTVQLAIIDCKNNCIGSRCRMWSLLRNHVWVTRYVSSS